VSAAAAARADLPSTRGEAVRVFFRHGSPRILAATFGAALVGRLALGDLRVWDLAPIAVLAALWPLQEWLIHVFILHWRPRRVSGRTLDFDVPRKHRAHHADPWRLDLLFIPEHVFLYGIPLHALFWLGVMPTPELALSGLAAYFGLALHYEWVHYLCHVRWAPRSRWYQRLVRNHRLHHFKNEHYWYGVTMLSADRWLHTRPDRDAVETSPTARSLHGLGAGAHTPT
jgi:hypothetical protein